MPRPWLLTTIFSGGQTGADRAGLVAAKALRYHTGGMVPKGCRTEAGPAPDLVTDFGCTASASADYKSRTFWNVQHSTGTVIFGDVTEGGSAYTMELCIGNRKPYIVNPTPNELRAWIYAHQIQILNVAGNRESRTPGIFQRVGMVLSEALIPF